MMSPTPIVGLIAASFTTITLLPQLMKVGNQVNSRYSTGMFMLYGGGLFLWFICRVFIDDLQIIHANSSAFVQALVIPYFESMMQLNLRFKTQVKKGFCASIV